MVTLIQLLVMLAATWVVAYRRERMNVCLLAVGGALLVTTLLTELRIIPWILFGLVATFYVAADLRRDFMSRPVFNIFKKILPPMTSTEQEALDAGDVWWDGELFRGNPDWQTMLSYPKPELSTEEQAFMDNEVETVCDMIDDFDVVQRRKDLPPEVWRYLKEKGFFGLIIPKEFGGKGFSALAHSSIVTKLGSKSVTLAVTAMVPNSLGPAELLMRYGTDDQKNHYLPRLAKGDDIPCFALTGPEAGSDAGALPDKGIVCKGEYNGKETLGIRVSWNKRYITLAPVATVLGLAFKLYDPENLLGGGEERGITVALIPTDHPGVEIGERHIPMGMAFMNGPTRGNDVFIPIDWIIGGPDYAGQGWRMLVDCLSEGRAISLPALSTATGKTAYRLTGAYSRVRKQFKTPIGMFEGVEEALARIAGHTYQLEAARLMTAGAVDQHVKPSVVSAIAKYHMTEKARSVMADAMDVHGGRGVIMGERNYLAHGYASMPISITVEGANILTRNLMIFGQGAVRCHPFVYKEMQAAANPDEQEGLQQFDELFFRHIGYGISNFVRTLSLSLTGGLIAKKPVKHQFGRYYQQLTRLSSALALTSDLSMMILGGDLKRKERLSARLGDVLSQLYLASTVLKYYEDQGQPAADVPYVHWTVNYALTEAQHAFLEFFDNFPNRFLGKLLKFVTFPAGRAYELPSDKLDHTIVQSMLTQNELRDRITKDMFIGNDENDPAARIEQAFQKVLAAQDIDRRVRKAAKAGKVDRKLRGLAAVEKAFEMGIVNEGDLEVYRKADEARLDAIQVDHYPPEFFTQTAGKSQKARKGKAA